MGFSGWKAATGGGMAATGVGSWLCADITDRAITPTVEPVKTTQSITSCFNRAVSTLTGRYLIQLALQVALEALLLFRRHGDRLGHG